jgi:HEAT repeat protein
VARQLAAALSAPDLRRAASEVLERMGQAAVEPLVEVVVTADPDARSQAADVLERLVGARPFVDRLGSTDPDERHRATEVLGSMAVPEAAEALLGALGDPEVRIRSRAATLLGAMGERRAIRPLKRMLLSDPVPEVAAAAEAALRTLGSVTDSDED